MLVGNLKVYGVIYKITNLINKKVYIGQTTKSFNKRYSYDGEGAERVYKYYKNLKEKEKYYNYHLLNSMEKYGVENFEVDKIIDVAFSKYELDIKEKSWILIYDSFNNGYNNCEGGKGVSGTVRTEEWRRNHSEKMIGENNPFYGKHHSEKTKEKLSDCFKGKKLSREHINNISKGHLGIEPWNKGKETCQETKDKISKSLSGVKNSNANIYKIIDLEGNEIIMCGNEIYNKGKEIGFFNINKKSFEKYILPYNEVNIENIKPKSMNQHTKRLIENLTPFNGWKVFLL